MRTNQFRPTATKLVVIMLLAMTVVSLLPAGKVATVASAQSVDTTVLEWNQHAVSVFHNQPTAATPGLGQPPQASALHVAIVQGAVFDAVNSIELYNRAFRTVAEERVLSTLEQARLFAMLNMAGADALINAWDDKVAWNHWRPITAIHAGNNDGNRLTIGDPTWTPLTAAPPYPESASGYNAITAAFMYVAEAYFGRGRTDFSLVRIAPGQADVTREYDRFRDVVDDTIGGRIYQGIHFRTSEVQGAGIGKNVAKWLEQHDFQPAD